MRRDLADFPMSADHDLITLEAGAIAIDVDEFNVALADPTMANLKRAAALYRGHLVEGLNARSDLFEEWLLGERARLRAAAIAAFHSLLQELHRGGAREEAVALALRLLAIDPLQEEVDRILMRLYSEQGQTALALRQYKRCETILRKELNVERNRKPGRCIRNCCASDRGARHLITPASLANPQSLSSNATRAIIQICAADDGVRIAYATVAPVRRW